MDDTVTGVREWVIRYCRLSVTSELCIYTQKKSKAAPINTNTPRQLVAETSTWQHTTLTTDIHGPPPPGRIRTRNPSKWATAERSRRPRGHRVRHITAVIRTAHRVVNIHKWYLWRQASVSSLTYSYSGPKQAHIKISVSQHGLQNFPQQHQAVKSFLE